MVVKFNSCIIFFLKFRANNELSNGLNKRISDVLDQSNAGIAGAYAMSSIATAPIGKRGVAFGTGFYNGEPADCGFFVLWLLWIFLITA